MSIITNVFTKENFKVTLLNVCNGISFGLVMGYSVSFLFIVLNSQQCEDFTTEKACSGDQGTKCLWNSNLNSCSVSEIHCIVFTKFYCGKSKDKGCYYDDYSKRCLHVIPVVSKIKAVWGSMSRFGGTLGSLLMWPAIPRLGIKLCLMASSIILIFGMILQTIACKKVNIPLSMFALFLTGLPCGAIPVCIPLYNHIMLPDVYINYILIMFQVGFVTGMLITTILAISFQVRDFAEDSHLSNRIFGMNIISLFILTGTSIFNFFMKEDTAYLCKINLANKIMKKLRLLKGEKNAQVAFNEQVLDNRKYHWREIINAIIAAVFLDFSRQLTGYSLMLNLDSNAGVMAMAKVNLLGLKTYAGQFVLDIWQFIATLIAPSVAAVIPTRNIYLYSYGAVICCCFVMMVFSADSSMSKTTQSAMSIFITLLFVTAYSLGIGPLYFIFVVNLFPTASRPTFCSIMIFLSYVISDINVFVLSSSFASLKKQTGNVGMISAIYFAFFLFIEIITFPILFFYLYPFYSTHQGIAVLREIKTQNKKNKTTDRNRNEEKRDNESLIMSFIQDDNYQEHFDK